MWGRANSQHLSGFFMRYILHPGKVTSRTDGDIHYISALALAKLYGIEPGKYVVYNRYGYREKDGDIHLYPRRDGNYQKVSST